MDTDFFNPNVISRMFITSTWLESIFFGMNCVLFGTCIYILANRANKSHRSIYFSSCIFHISVSTAHAIISLIRSVKAFTTPAIISIPDGGGLYLFNTTTLFMTSLILYMVNIFAQDLLLIWRLYIVWNRNWKLAIISLIVGIASIVCTTLGLAFLVQPKYTLFSPIVRAFAKASWSLDFSLNTSLTTAIAYRLWRAGRDVSNHTNDKNIYKAAMMTIIESGALISSYTIIMFVLSMTYRPACIMAVNVGVQIATTTPLLIIARLSLRFAYGDTQSEKSASVHLIAPVSHAFSQGTVSRDSDSSKC